MNIFINMMTLLTEHCPAILVSMPVFVIMITPTSMNTLPLTDYWEKQKQT